MSLQGRKIYIYDTTLRDGSQGQGASWTLEDKVRISYLPDYFEVDYIEDR